MGYKVLGFTHSALAGSDLSASYGCAITLGSDGKMALPSAGGSIVGILMDKPVANQEAGYQFSGIAEMKLGGTVAVDDFVKVDASGRAVAASGTEVTNGQAVGRCLEGGTINQLGAVLLGTLGAGTIAEAGSESINSSVDVSVNTEETLITLVTGDHVGVMADGKFVGQKKRTRVISADGSHKYTLTPTTMQAGQPTSFVYNRLAQAVDFTWSATGWVVTGIKAAGAETVAASGTANPLCLVHGVAVADTVAFTQPSGYVPGHRSIWVALSNSGTPVGTVSGLYYDEDGSADGVTLNFNAAADQAILEWDGARWFADTEVSITVS